MSSNHKFTSKYFDGQSPSTIIWLTFILSLLSITVLWKWSTGETGHVSIVLLSQAFREKSPAVISECERCPRFFSWKATAVKCHYYSPAAFTYLIRMVAHWAHRDTIEGIGDDSTAESLKLVFQLQSFSSIDRWLNLPSFSFGTYRFSWACTSCCSVHMSGCSKNMLFLRSSHLFVCKHLWRWRWGFSQMHI